MAENIDVSFNCGNRAAALAGAGVRRIMRYYSRDTIRPAKRLTLTEARQLSDAGLRIGIVHEGRFGDQPGNFTHDCGFADAQYAQHYGQNTIGQPPGTTIYYGVDFDATAAQVRDLVLPYFQGIADGLAALGGPTYAVGVYGSGRTCAAVLSAGLAGKAWLAQSTGWGEYNKFLATGLWTLSQGAAATIADVPCDPDTLGEGKAIGDFTLAASPTASAPASVAASQYVIARSGLRLREGPGTNFEAHPQALPYGARVFALKKSAGWTLVDLEGDGKADGFVSSEYLSATAPAGLGTPPALPAPTPPAPQTADATRVAELIRQGSGAAGLKQARTTAAASLPGYPTNGCAAHLSALLQQAGIDVPMTWGAGKLATVIAARGWSRIAVGQQVAGDVGVCFDNNPNPPGADHIYLVVQTSGPDEMTIADNQRTTDAPHERFATGHGKTPTEYFLRAL